MRKQLLRARYCACVPSHSANPWLWPLRRARTSPAALRQAQVSLSAAGRACRGSLVHTRWHNVPGGSHRFGNAAANEPPLGLAFGGKKLPPVSFGVLPRGISMTSSFPEPGFVHAAV